MANEEILAVGLVAFLRTIPELASPTIRIEPVQSSQSSTMPRLRYVKLGTITNHISNSGPSNLKLDSFQLDIIDATYLGAQRLAAAVMAKDGFKGIWTSKIRVGLFRALATLDVPQTPTGGSGLPPFVERLTLMVWHSLEKG